jgi:hypothetical protein
MNIALIDYGTGNLHSLVKALETYGARVSIRPDLNGAEAADGIVLPGVGAFGAASAQLAASADSLRQAIAAGTPCLGICLGMQLLFESSEEGLGAGLGVLEGDVRRLHARRLPHMGWNDVLMMDDPLFTGCSSCRFTMRTATSCSRRMSRTSSPGRSMALPAFPPPCGSLTSGACSSTRRRAAPRGCASSATSWRRCVHDRVRGD